MACLGLVIFFPLRPDFKLPCFIAFTSRSTLAEACRLYFLVELFFAAVFFAEGFFVAVSCADFFALLVFVAVWFLPNFWEARDGAKVVQESTATVARAWRERHQWCLRQAEMLALRDHVLQQGVGRCVFRPWLWLGVLHPHPPIAWDRCRCSTRCSSGCLRRRRRSVPILRARGSRENPPQ